MQLNFNVMPEVLNRASRAFLDSQVKPENDKNVSLLIAILVSKNRHTKDLLNHPYSINTFKYSRCNCACYQNLYIVSVWQKVDDISPFEFHHQVRYPIIVIISYAVAGKL